MLLRLLHQQSCPQLDDEQRFGTALQLHARIFRELCLTINASRSWWCKGCLTVGPVAAEVAKGSGWAQYTARTADNGARHFMTSMRVREDSHYIDLSAESRRFGFWLALDSFVP